MPWIEPRKLTLKIGAWCYRLWIQLEFPLVFETSRWYKKCFSWISEDRRSWKLQVSSRDYILIRWNILKGKITLGEIYFLHFLLHTPCIYKNILSPHIRMLSCEANVATRVCWLQLSQMKIWLSKFKGKILHANTFSWVPIKQKASSTPMKERQSKQPMTRPSS